MNKWLKAMVAVADHMGLPVVITQDSHYLLPEDRDDHEPTSSDSSAWGPDPDDAVFPGDGFHLADQSMDSGPSPRGSPCART